MKKANYFKLIFNRLLDQIGNVTYDYANSVWIASMGALGQKFLGIYQISETIISIIFNPIAGAIADKSKRKKILLTTDAISAIICILISLIGNNQLLLYGIIVANIVLAITYSFSSTAFKSMVSNVIDSEEIVSFNSSVETILQTLSVISPVITYYIYNAWGIRIALLINGLSFIGSFLAILTIKENTEQRQVEETKEKVSIKQTFAELFDDIKAGLKYINSSGALIELLVLSAFVNYFISIYNYLLPFSASIFGNKEVYSRLLLFGALGSIVGALLSKFVPNTRFNLLVALGLSGLGIAAIALPPLMSLPLIIAYAGNFAFMTFLTVYNIHFVSTVQLKVADEYIGRVFSTVFTIAILFMPLGTATITLMPAAINSLTYVVVGLAIAIIPFLAIILKRSK
ncbi:MAG: MFS transporter [Lactobacillus sp.]|nr:MFS transporter [Lactobacillus sp.]